MKILFAGPENTAIANEDKSFINRLELAAGSRAGLQVTKHVERADVIVVDEKYAYRTWSYADVLRSCPFVKRHAGRMVVLNHDDHARVFLSGLYVSLERSRPPLVPALPIPYKWDLWAIDIARIPRKRGGEFLWTFRGSCRTHPIRREVWTRLHRDRRGSIEVVDRQLHTHTNEDQLAFANSLLSGAFSLCPRGISPSSYRVYESMQLGRCPVVISDDWTAPTDADWGACSIRVSEADIGKLAGMLESERDRASELGRRAAAEWGRCFSWPVRFRMFLDNLVKVTEMPGFGANFEELSSCWESSRFRNLYGWTVPGRLRSRIKREIDAIQRRRFEYRLKATSRGVGRSMN